MFEVKFLYKPSEQLLKRWIRETGKLPARDQVGYVTATYDLEAATPELRAALAERLTVERAGQEIKLPRVEKVGERDWKKEPVVNWSWSGGDEYTALPAFDAEPTLADFIAAFDALVTANVAVRAEVARQHAEWQIADDGRNAREAEEKAQREEVRRRDQAWQESEKERKSQLAAQHQAEKIAWAAEHGSSHLQRALAAGHSCDRLYQVERTALEYPGFVLDYEDTAEWKDRACPSEKALDERDAVLKAHTVTEVKIVWLTAEPQDAKRPEREEEWGEENEFEACEAVAVDDPHYSKWLVKEM